MSELIQFDGRTVAIIAPEDLEQIETEIERLRDALDAVTTVEGNIMELERKATQRGARMQIMREWLYNQWHWKNFLHNHPEAYKWFDEDGVPR